MMQAIDTGSQLSPTDIWANISSLEQAREALQTEKGGKEAALAADSQAILDGKWDDQITQDIERLESRIRSVGIAIERERANLLDAEKRVDLEKRTEYYKQGREMVERRDELASAVAQDIESMCEKVNEIADLQDSLYRLVLNGKRLIPVDARRPVHAIDSTNWLMDLALLGAWIARGTRVHTGGSALFPGDNGPPAPFDDSIATTGRTVIADLAFILNIEEPAG